MNEILISPFTLKEPISDDGIKVVCVLMEKNPYKINIEGMIHDEFVKHYVKD